MASRNRLLVPKARQAMDRFKTNVMKKEGYQTDNPAELKYEVAQSLGIPLQKGYNGHLESKDAGKIGGKIGGSMVKEMVRLAQEQLKQQ
ncbi:alpha/beta hydrolase [Ammoniphilus oxalaticus]|uniref:Alpha/beta hydrolase n=1 Tax=Ammoniphilus oxalaticus TaxID=66863 RepID=A0A419SMI5_9BACL|nr:alpha/beta-type small acid-soluble spore protein [Ammoniphilus oxalaticus]RKD25508.1 alpha/beta hydrolase [Ammoniphilus oxalaticus]